MQNANNLIYLLIFFMVYNLVIILETAYLQVWTMVGIYIVIATLAIVITAVFVDQLPDDLQQMKRRPVAREVGEMCVATFKHMRLISQLLLIPITMLSGFEQSFFSAEFTKVKQLSDKL